MIELTNKPNQKLISKSWPDITYNNINLFDNYLAFLGWLEDNCQLLKHNTWEETLEEINDEGEIEQYTENVSRYLQESYLGYIPSIDTFVTGFDMWEGDDDNPAGQAMWKLNEHNTFTLISEDILYGCKMVYGTNGLYHKLHKQFPDILDLRLD